MSDSEEVDKVDDAVRALYRTRYNKACSWTDSFSEFREYVDTKTHKHYYFKVFQVPSTFRYSEDSHQRIACLLPTHLLPLQVTLYQQDFATPSYLLRSDHNYITLCELIKLKNSNHEQPQPKFIIHILNFFRELIPRLVEEHIECEISPKTICFREEKVKLCDYNLLFFPCNKRKDDVEGLQGVLVRRAAAVVYSLLGNQLREEGERVKVREATGLLLNLSEKEPWKSNLVLMEVVRGMLLENFMDASKIEQLMQKMIYDSAISLTESNVTTKDENISQLLEPLNKAMTLTSTSQTNDESFSKPSKSKKITKVIISTVFLLILLVSIGYCIYYFTSKSPLCKQDQYLENNTCFPCANGCKECLGKLTNMCTSCKGLRWLVKQTVGDNAGSCSDDCYGIQLSDSRLCIMPKID